MSSIEDIKSGEEYDRFRDEAEGECPCDECGAHENVRWCFYYGGNLCTTCEDEFFDEEWWEEDE